MNHDTEETSTVKPPVLATHIVRLLLPNRLLENVLGDLEEEFHLLAKQDAKRANQWYWRQAIETSMVYLQKKISSVEVLGRLNFYLPVFMFLMVAGLVTVLSVLEDPKFISATFWDELLQGKIHTALFSANFWHNFWSILAQAQWSMFIHLESFLIASVNIMVLVYLSKKQQASTLKLVIWGYSLAVIPYVWSMIHIINHSFEAQQIGPIIATGILSLLYMLLPISYMVHRRLKQQQNELRIFNGQKLQQDSHEQD